MCFRQVLRLVKLDQCVIFLDEAVFTQSLQQTKAWTRSTKDQLVQERSKIGFKAVAVTSAIDLHGRVITTKLVEKAVNQLHFQEFLRQL